jgi:hypothetical protein
MMMKSNVSSVLVSAMLAIASSLATQPALSEVARLPFRSSFEAGSFGEWNGGLDATMTVTGTQATDGSRSAQSVMVAGQTTDNYKEYVFGDHPRVGGSPVTTTQGMWLSFDSKFDSGFQFASGAIVHKIAIVNFEDSNSRRRYQLLLNVYVPERVYFFEHLVWNADGSFNRSNTGISQNVGTRAQVRLGQWDKFKIFIKPNTPGRADGVVKMWVNGELKLDHSTIAIRDNTSYNPNKLIMSNYVNSASAAGIQRWDNWYLGETEPAATVRPNPPVLDRVQ